MCTTVGESSADYINETLGFGLTNTTLVLSDARGVTPWISTTAFAALLAVVFGIWYARERTLSIHTIVTTPRETFYWLAVLVTFALGTAAGDWTLELTGWSPGAAVMLPLGLILAVLAAWKLGAGPVRCPSAWRIS